MDKPLGEKTYLPLHSNTYYLQGVLSAFSFMRPAEEIWKQLLPENSS
jgi:hypothetical protein